MRERKIEGGLCALCRVPIGLVSINGKAVEVESTAVVWDDVVILKLHCCSKLPEVVPAGSNGKKARK